MLLRNTPQHFRCGITVVVIVFHRYFIFFSLLHINLFIDDVRAMFMVSTTTYLLGNFKFHEWFSPITKRISTRFWWGDISAPTDAVISHFQTRIRGFDIPLKINIGIYTINYWGSLPVIIIVILR